MGWLDEVDPDELFASGKAWGISVTEIPADATSRRIASVGGMTVPLMDPHSQYAAVREQIARAIGDVIDSGRFILGPRVAEAESVFAARVGAAHGIGVANGTDALVIALRALGVEPRRRGHLPVVHVLRDRRVDRRRSARCRCSPTSRTRPTASIRRPSRPRSRRAPARSCRCTCSGTRRRWAPLRAICERARARAARGRRPGVRRVARRRPLRRARRRGDVLVLPDQEPALLRRRRPDHDAERRGRPHVPRAALPRLRGQEDVHARRLQLAARRAAGGDPARAAAAASTAGTTAASPWPRATPSSASASTSCCRRSPTGARHIYHLYIVRSAGARAPRRRRSARRASAAASTTRRRSTCSRCSRTSATPRARCR